MTTNRVLSAVSFLGIACVGALAAPSSSWAQCQPDDIFCAELRIGPGRPPPPPPVVVTPPPPPVVVQPPPPVVVVPPRPPVVIVAPAQPPPPPPRQVVVIAPPPRREPQVVAVQVERRQTTRYELVPQFDFGIHLALSGVALAEDSGMAGFSAGFRLRPIEHIGLDLTIGAFGGQSWLYEGNGGDRWEVPLLADVLFFFNPQHRVQFYALVGFGGSYAVQQFAGGRERDFGYVGGEAGLGLEFRIGRHFALNLDVRGFVRQQVQDDDGPEFSRRTSSGALQTTDTSGGVYGNVGMTFYFGR